MLDAAFVSVPNLKWPGAKLAADGSFDADYKYSRSAGHPADEDTWIVPFAESPSSLNSLRGLSAALPGVWAELNRPADGGR
jgi:hypothetical protein